MFSIGSSKFFKLGDVPLQQLKFGWTEIGGDFLTPAGKLYDIIHFRGVNLSRIKSSANMRKSVNTAKDNSTTRKWSHREYVVYSPIHNYVPSPDAVIYSNM